MSMMADYESGGRDSGFDTPAAFGRSLARAIRKFVNSPFSFVLSTCLLIGFVLTLLFYRFHRMENVHSSSSSSSSTDSSNGSGFSKSPQRSNRHLGTLNGCVHKQHRAAPIGHAACSSFNSDDGLAGAVDGSQRIGSATESPRMHLMPQSNNQYILPSSGQQLAGSDCTHYKSSLCPQQIPDQSNHMADYTTYMPMSYGCNSGTLSGAHQTKDSGIDESQVDDQCLVQMLMLGSNQSSRLPEDGSEMSHCTGNNNLANLHATLGRLKGPSGTMTFGAQMSHQLPTSMSLFANQIGSATIARAQH